MRKVCRLAREVLDIAARAAKPGVTTDHIDEIVHQACMEREVRGSSPYHKTLHSQRTVLPIAAKLLPFPQVGMHISQRGYLSRHSRPARTPGWRYPEY